MSQHTSPQYAPGNRTYKSHANYKNSLCEPFQKTGECRFGDTCTFAHGEAELKKYRKLIPCKYYLDGRCNQGSRCDYKHEDTQPEETSDYKPLESSPYSSESKDSILSNNSVSKVVSSPSSVLNATTPGLPPMYTPDDKPTTPEIEVKAATEPTDICIQGSAERLNNPVCNSFDEDFYSRYYFYHYRTYLTTATPDIDNLLFAVFGPKMKETIDAVVSQAFGFYKENLNEYRGASSTFTSYGKYSRFDANRVIWTAENVETYARVAAAYRMTTLTGEGVHQEDPVILPLPLPPPAPSFAFSLAWQIAYQYKRPLSRALDIVAYMYAKVGKHVSENL